MLSEHLMGTDSVEICAVLSGDIIGSTALSVEELESIRALVRSTVADFRSVRPGVITSDAEFFRGDSWQVCLADPGHALRLALYVRAKLRGDIKSDTRIAIGIGSAERIVPDQVSLSIGEAFVLSGRALDAMTGHFELGGALPRKAGPMNHWFPVILHLCSTFVRSWTQRQAQIVTIALATPDSTHEGIAKTLDPPVSKQTVTDSLAGAGSGGRCSKRSKPLKRPTG